MKLVIVVAISGFGWGFIGAGLDWTAITSVGGSLVTTSILIALRGWDAAD